uniref:F-box domain-containing protein n=1 Tax=Rhizophagus irregularis (strain DAOM 181602 / DAOM 197198 / MUCL 43194) TaxID=747089 RepID=U9UVF2_RHIID
MACSKLFLGDLPELISKVIQYFRYNHKTLHSCILVNRLWCRLAIPLLWEDPFSIKDPKNYHFIKIYLHYLNDDDKTKLNEYVIHNELFPTNTLFNYPSFIQRLNTYKVCYSVQKWIATVKTSTTSNERYFVRNTNLTFIQILNFTKLIYKSLFLIFIENKVNLHSFEVTLPKDIDIDWFDEIFELILQNPNFIYNIKNFEINLYIITADNITKFLRVVYSNCYSISSLYIIVPKYYDISTYSIIEKSLSQLINSQENLQKISFGFNKFPLYHSLLSLKSHNCSNTLNTIIFYYVNFKDIIVLNEVFNQLNVLESIHIVCCYSLDYNFIQQISNVIRPFKLKSLFLHETLQIESLKLLIQKSGNYLENFGISFGITDNESQQLLPLIIKYSSKIKYLETTWLDNENIILVQLYYKI